ncbi:hypothetical protein T459_03712 [Capsicum annuum]|uniref:Uncharacterized protein n=1 Tax=Capsicum annuum TaxID=4072 RepID=A0A2G3ANP4_CAPAN|nr:hypothetical protein FXO37_26426 [Capsicum annuum]PHT95830.1 hypothetical protein T459_03712 [Capsicum annuum]
MMNGGGGGGGGVNGGSGGGMGGGYGSGLGSTGGHDNVVGEDGGSDFDAGAVYTRDNLKVNMMVQLWSFRKDSDRWLALVVVPPTPNGKASDDMTSALIGKKRNVDDNRANQLALGSSNIASTGDNSKLNIIEHHKGNNNYANLPTKEKSNMNLSLNHNTKCFGNQVARKQRHSTVNRQRIQKGVKANLSWKTKMKLPDRHPPIWIL